MIKSEFEPLLQAILLKPETGRSLQDEINEALKNGVQRIILEGHYTSNGEKLFSLVTIDHDIEIIGNGKTVLDGQKISTHLLFIQDGIKVKITGVRFFNGNTANNPSRNSAKNHFQERLNIFRYIDGGAISLGGGSELVLEDCCFEENHSAVCGGAISNMGGYLHLERCVFENNTCGDTGAAIDNLVAGSLTVIDHCRFSNNNANQLGDGTYGAVTAFPDTFMVVKHSDFSGETATAIDYRPNKQGHVFVSIDESTVFNPENPYAIVKNPESNKGARKEILLRCMSLLIQHPDILKLERVPSVSKEIKEKHRKRFEECALN